MSANQFSQGGGQAYVQEVAEGTLVRIHVQPRSSKSEICGMHGDRLKLRIQSPPVDGAANRECKKILAKLFKIPKSSLHLKSGVSSREKTFFLEGVKYEDIVNIVDSVCANLK